MIKRYLKAFVLLLVAPIIGCEVIRDKIKENRAKTIIVAALISVVTICAFMPEQELKITDLSAAFSTGQKRTMQVDVITIHHTAGSRNDKVNDLARFQLQRFGVVAYHFLVMPDGTIYQLRPLDERVPHAYGYNDNAIAICLVGNFNDYEVPDAQYNALVALTKNLAKQYNIPTDRVKRHCDLNNTECPGTMFDFETFIDDID